MSTLGILVRKPEQSQKFEAITHCLNQLTPEHETILFCSEPGQIIGQTNYPIMEFVEALNYNGILIATDIYSALVVSEAIQAKKKFFYIWDMESIYINCSFGILKKVFLNPDIEILVRNQTRYDAFSQTWKKPHSILEDFNHNELARLL